MLLNRGRGDLGGRLGALVLRETYVTWVAWALQRRSVCLFVCLFLSVCLFRGKFVCLRGGPSRQGDSGPPTQWPYPTTRGPHQPPGTLLACRASMLTPLSWDRHGDSSFQGPPAWRICAIGPLLLIAALSNELLATYLTISYEIGFVEEILMKIQVFFLVLKLQSWLLKWTLLHTCHNVMELCFLEEFLIKSCFLFELKKWSSWWYGILFYWRISDENSSLVFIFINVKSQLS